MLLNLSYYFASFSDGKRELGTLELFCAGCRKWFHGRCLKDLTELYVLFIRFNFLFNVTFCLNFLLLVD